MFRIDWLIENMIDKWLVLLCISGVSKPLLIYTTIINQKHYGEMIIPSRFRSTITAHFILWDSMKLVH